MAASDDDTVRLDPVEPDGGPRRRTTGGARAAIIVGVVLVIVAALLVLVETVGRGIAERAVADAIERDLPEGVEGEVDVQIRGVSALWQAATGRMDEMVATAPELSVNGVEVDATVTAYGVPLAEGGSVERAEAVASVDEAAVDAIAESQAIDGGLTLGDGTVSYSDELDILGLTVGFAVTAEPEAAGDRVLLTPVAAELQAGFATLDASDLVDRVLGGEPFPVCVADRLPEGVELAGIDVTPDGATVRLEASGLPIAEDTLATTGTCG
ncbi:LmeA family phospholipid-binding protein [Agromyces sp. ZXT2-6]|uniref:LmeA family phospholipid-binding protein n=1 Tax=Agromyces sp. ZXT2-6 TaxID=3461153 RepID=UPI004054B106